MILLYIGPISLDGTLMRRGPVQRRVVGRDWVARVYFVLYYLNYDSGNSKDLKYRYVIIAFLSQKPADFRGYS